jgi:hypothetical protein
LLRIKKLEVVKIKNAKALKTISEVLFIVVKFGANLQLYFDSRPTRFVN